MKSLNDLLFSIEILKSKLNTNSEIASVTADSRRICAGALFIAIRGTKMDGHDFVAAAVSAGAAILVDRPEIYEKYPHTILVGSTREVSGKVFSRFYGEPTKKFPLVGVTGTNGKTTTTFLLEQTWRNMGLKAGLIGTVENRILDSIYPTQLTTPGPDELQQLFSKMVSCHVGVAAMEVTSIALDQYRVNGCHFEVGVFTNFTLDHLDYHGSMENYYQAKLKLFRDFDLKAAVINLDDPMGRRLLSECQSPVKISYSLKDSNADFYASPIQYEKSGTQATLSTPRGEMLLETPLIGPHNVYNAMCVLAVLQGLGMDIKSGLSALKNAPGAPGRFERIMVGDRYPHIFVDYAHTDDALKNVLGTLRGLKSKESDKSGLIITVFGCGGDRDRTKRPKMGSVVSEWSDISIATSDNPRTEDPGRIIDDIETGILKKRTQYFREVDRKQAIHLALEMAKPEDIVLVAGKGHETYQILGTQKVDFDDRAVIREYYA